MFNLRVLFDIYIKASFHVALMVLTFFEITHFQWGNSSSLGQRILVFSLAFMAYNAVKYYPFSRKIISTPWLYWVLIPCGIICFIASTIVFFALSNKAQLLLFSCFGLTVAYTVPLGSALGNLRSQFGLKIFIVALCWTFLTAIFPLIDLPYWDGSHYIFFLERFILIFIATLPFELKDLAKDKKALGTIPQLIGSVKTRRLGSALLLLLLIFKGSDPNSVTLDFIALSFMCIAYFIALFVVDTQSSEKITLFWVELIPALGWMCYRLIEL